MSVGSTRSACRWWSKGEPTASGSATSAMPKRSRAKSNEPATARVADVKTTARCVFTIVVRITPPRWVCATCSARAPSLSRSSHTMSLKRGSCSPRVIAARAPASSPIAASSSASSSSSPPRFRIRSAANATPAIASASRSPASSTGSQRSSLARRPAVIIWSRSVLMRFATPIIAP